MADLIISQPMTFTVDVKNGLVERPQRESLMRGDRMANRIIAELVYGSEPFDITDVTVKGKFCRPPNGDEIDLAGEAKGNVAEVQLTDQCYTSGGHYEARVILVLGGVERTVLFISGDVLKSGSGNAAGDEETGGSGGTGSGLPAGGTAGQVLVKVSSAQGDAIWKNLTAADVGALPSDGTAANATRLNGKDADEYALKTDLPTKASDVGALASDGTAADSEKLGGVAASEYAKLTDRPMINENTTYVVTGFLEKPTSASNTVFTTPADGNFYLFATRGEVAGNTIRVFIIKPNGETAAQFNFPAYYAYAVIGVMIPVKRGMKIMVNTDKDTETWTIREQKFYY